MNMIKVQMSVGSLIYAAYMEFFMFPVLSLLK